MAGRDWHRAAILATSAAIAVLGVAMVAVTLARGGGPLAAGVVVGTLFALAGGGRLYTTVRGG